MTDSPRSRGLPDLVRLLDRLEAQTTGYISLDNLTTEGVGDDDVQEAIEQQLVLVDYRQRLNASRDGIEAVTLCRLNRHHPLVRELASD